MAADRRTTLRRLLYGLAAVLVGAAAAVTVWMFWPEISYTLGMRGPDSVLLAPATDFPSPELSSADTTIAAAGEEAGGPTTVAEEQQTAGIGTAAAPKTSKHLIIPKIGVSLGIYGGDGDRALKFGAYHHVSTSVPGGGREIVLAGHRTSKALALLYKLEKGDAITIDWNGTEYRYKVTKKYIASPTDKRILADSPTEVLRIYTCVPRWNGNKRLVVEALPD